MRRRLCSRLAAAGHLVLADDADGDAATVVGDLRPDVVVFDWSGRRDTGLEGVLGAVPGGAADGQEPSWVALVSGDALTGASAWAAGFDDVVTPPHDVQEIAARVDAVLARRSRRSRLGFGDVTIDLDDHEVWRGEHRLSLTATEFRLLVTLLRHPNHVLSKRQLLELVWGFDDYDANVVEVQISALRRKLEVWGPRVIHTVRGVGYVARQGQGAPSTSTSTS